MQDVPKKSKFSNDLMPTRFRFKKGGNDQAVLDDGVPSKAAYG